MKTLCLVVGIALALPPAAVAGEFVLRDSDCRMMHADKAWSLTTSPGDKSEHTCVTVGREASCNYRSLQTGKSQGEATKYEVVEIGGLQIWTSPSGNIKVVIRKKDKRYFYGMTSVLLEAGALMNKQCVGTIVRAAD